MYLMRAIYHASRMPDVTGVASRLANDRSEIDHPAPQADRHDESVLWAASNNGRLTDEELHQVARTMRCDGEPVQTGSRDTPLNVQGVIACKAEWDPARGHHHGQRSKSPHQTGRTEACTRPHANSVHPPLQCGSHPQRTCRAPSKPHVS